MNKIVRDNLDKGFPSNGDFLSFLDNEFVLLNNFWKDEVLGGVNQIIKGVLITKSASDITLGAGVIVFNNEVFFFDGATLATTDLSEIDLYVDEAVTEETFADLNNYPAFKYRALNARILAGGNFRTIARSFVIPIREYDKPIKLNASTAILKHSILEHNKNGVKINATTQLTAGGASTAFINPIGSGNEIFDIYYKSSYRTYNNDRLAGNWSVLTYNGSNTVIGVANGVIIQRGALFHLYNNSGVPQTLDTIAGVAISGFSYANVMLDFDVITALV
ncbi:MAG: hypothetical protein H6Q15_1771 [Bacteroidetes bacterium]|nr:hypothetical protein [Bacteroidota bacterium]